MSLNNPKVISRYSIIIMDGTCNGEIPDLVALMQPLFCKLCETRLNSPFQASAHYAGKNHMKKVKIYLKETKPNIALQSAESTKEEICSSLDALPTGNVKTANVPADKVFDAKLFGLYCKLCDVAFNSEVQAQQHYRGRNHQRRIQGELPLPKGFYDATTNKWIRIPSEIDPKIRTENSTSGRQPQEVTCTTCNCSVTSQNQLEMHLAGAKHRAKVAMLEKHNIKINAVIHEQLRTTQTGLCTGFALSDVMISHAEPEEDYPAKKIRPSTSEDFSMYRTPSGMLYCAKCNVNMNSEMQFAQHFSSKRHNNRGSNKRYVRDKAHQPKYSGAHLQSD